MISGITSPFLVLPAFFVVLADRFARSRREALIWAIVGVAGLVGVPFAYVVVGVARGRITDIHVSLREQRLGPFVAALCGAVTATLLLFLCEAPVALQLAALATAVNGVIFATLTQRHKLSMHPSVLAACLVMAGVLVAPGWFAGLAGLPLVMWARVRRRRHSWPQTLVATALAAFIAAVMVQGYLLVFAPFDAAVFDAPTVGAQ